MDTKKTTILLIKNDDSEVKSFKVDTHFITHYRRYLYALGSLVILFFMCVLGMLYHISDVNSENNGLTGRINNLNKQFEYADSIKLKEKLSDIDNNLSLINTYLQNRGVLITGNAGGEPSMNHESNTGKVQSLEKETGSILNTIQNMPLGIPYPGPVSSGYGYRKNPFGGFRGEFHPGVDFKGQIGDPIYATGTGIVERCDWYGGYGNAVLIKHSCGLESLFGHMVQVNVIQGQVVNAGDLIGFLGTTGRSTGPHVHYEIRKDGSDIDPVPFLTIQNEYLSSEIDNGN